MPLSAQDFKDKAAARRKARTKDVTIPDIGVVRLRSLSAGDAIAFQSEVRKAKAAGGNEEELTFPFIARSWVGEDNELLFPEEEGIAFAKTLDPETFKAIATECLKLNGLSEEAIAEAEGFSSAGRENGSSPIDSLTSTATRT